MSPVAQAWRGSITTAAQERRWAVHTGIHQLGHPVLQRTTCTGRSMALAA